MILDVSCIALIMHDNSAHAGNTFEFLVKAKTAGAQSLVAGGIYITYRTSMKSLYENNEFCFRLVHMTRMWLGSA